MSPRPPGFLRQQDEAEVLMMIGTAGHVDHGKTRLVRLLTGCETDKLKTEKERGLSIELGFAPCSLGSGIAAGIVDVPGHEQFIKNMVAGAAGMDVAMLVVAADDGVMPQTIEHLQIMQFLGVQCGMVALTKIDLVTPQRVEEVSRQIESLCKGTFLKGASICPISSETFEGFDNFYKTLVATTTSAKIKREHGVFRMPVERVFSPPGFGAVVSGIPLAGSVSVGEELEVQPTGVRARVRGIQRFLREAEGGGAGQCLAVNLAGLTHDTVQRGHVITQPGYVKPASFLQVMLTTCSNLALPLQDGEEMRMHTGTLEVQCHINIYTDKNLKSNQQGYGAIRLQESIAVSPTDRFVLRRNSPAVTVAGGVVLEALNKRPRSSRAQMAKGLTLRWASFATPLSRFEHHFIALGASGSTLIEASRLTLIEKGEGLLMLDELVANGKLLACPQERFIHALGLKQASEKSLTYLRKYHDKKPSDFGPTLVETTSALRLPDAIIEYIMKTMLDKGEIERSDNRIGMSGRGHGFDARLSKILIKMEELLRQGRYATPRPDELPALLGASPGDITALLDYHCQSGTLVRLGKNVVFHKQWMNEAERLVVETIMKTGQLDSGDFKAMIGSSRKYALAILDHFDTVAITHRLGNIRHLHPAYLRKHPELKK
jgi:selenocysteine-specific elongation factor